MLPIMPESQTLDNILFAPDQNEVCFAGGASGFWLTPARTPGRGDFAFELSLNKLLAIESLGLPQNTVFPLILH